jgi:hypothetical protein
MFFRIAADIVLLVHLAFIVLVVAGALLVLRYGWFAWIHLPAAAWGAFVELTGRICPLTTLENAMRVRAGQEGYAVSFVEQYLLPVIYPTGLTREVQFWLAGLVIAINAILYTLIWRRRRRLKSELGQREENTQ